MRNVGLASTALSVMLFGLVIWHGMASGFLVSDCSGYCTNEYDYSPLNPPVLLALGLFSFGILTAATTGLLPASNKPKGNDEKSGPMKLEVLLYSYIAVPFVTVILLLALAGIHVWSGSPAPYVGTCLGTLILFPGVQVGWCYSLIWDGFWIDTLLYTTTGYGIIIFLAMIPKIRPPCLPLSELEDRPCSTKA